jgi:hypothetical protein
MTLQEQQDKLYENMAKSDYALKLIVANNRDQFGLVFDSVKQTKEYKEAKGAYQRDFQAVRTFNSQFAKLLHK